MCRRGGRTADRKRKGRNECDEVPPHAITIARTGPGRNGRGELSYPPATAYERPASFSAACAAASRASGTRYGEHET